MKKLFTAFVLVLGIFLIVGCGEREETPELVIVSNFGSQVAEQELYRQELFAPFEEEHNVEIRFEQLGHSDAFNKIDVEQQTGEHTVDLLISHFGNMIYYLEEDYMLDVSQLEADMDDRTFITTFDANTHMNDTRYFFPINADVYVTIANLDALDDLPGDLTEADLEAGNYTWDDYVEWGNNMEGHKVFMKALPDGQLLYQIGGMALSHGGTFPKMDDAGNIRAWEQVLAMKDAIHPESINNAAGEGLLLDDSVYLAFEHMAVVASTYATAPAKYGVYPGPLGDDGKAGSIAGGHGVGIVNNAPNQELAEKFIEFMTSEAKIRHAALGTIPTIEEAELGDDPEDFVLEIALDTIANANVEGLQMIPDYSDFSAVKGVYDDIYEGIMDGSIDEENLVAKLEEAQSDLEDLYIGD